MSCPMPTIRRAKQIVVVVVVVVVLVLCVLMKVMVFFGFLEYG